MKLSRPHAIATFLLSIFLSGVCSCVLSPMPEPPQVDLDPDNVQVETKHFAKEIRIVGCAGAATAGSVVRAFNLENSSPPVQATVQDDGSFLVRIRADSGDEVRLQAMTSEARSEPIDIIIGFSSGSVQLAERALGHCLFLTPESVAEINEIQSVTIENQCEHEVTIETPVMRRPLQEVTVGQGIDWPFILSPNEEIIIEITVEPTWITEEILLIEISDPEYDRRPITLIF